MLATEEIQAILSADDLMINFEDGTISVSFQSHRKR